MDTGSIISSNEDNDRKNSAPKMIKFIVLASVCVLAFASPIEDKPTALELEQNKNAKYEFLTNVEDHINDLTIRREETRNGLKLEGSYSYSDGYVKRVVHYEADDDGFRIIREEETPLEGPKVDVHGTASILHKAHGSELQYSVKSVPLDEHEK